MQYCGGKTKVARQIVRRIALDGPVQSWWEPFCGGLSVSVELVRAFGAGRISDANAALVALYRAMRDGWSPPPRISDAVWRVARHLPDADPLKAFCGFALSYGGKWFDGRARDGRNGRRSFESRAAEALERKVAATSRCELLEVDFLACCPAWTWEVLYCDPPYLGCKQAYGLGRFDSDRFWEAAAKWALAGSRVYVSEYVAPSPWRCIAEFRPGRGINARRKQDGPVERLWALDHKE